MADGKVIIEIDAEDKEAQAAFKRLQDSADKAKRDTEDFGDSAEKAGSKAENSADGLNELSVAAAAVSAALIASTSAAVNMATEFEASFAKVETIMDYGAMSAEILRGQVLDLSMDSTMAAADVSEAVYQAISGSVSTANAAQFVANANKLAVAGFTELTSATDILTTTLNAYQMSEEQVVGISNVLIQTQNLGKTSVNDLSAYMGRAVATASAYEVNLQNVAASYVELTRGGIATAEATTYLSGMLNELGKSNSNVAKIIQEETGSSFGALMERGQSLGDVLQILSDSVNGNAEAMMNLWSSQEAGKAANAIMTQGIEDFNNVLSQMNNEMSGVSSTTDNAYATMTSTSEFINKRFSNSISNLGISLGSGLTPVISDIKSTASDVMDTVTEFLQESPDVSAVIGGLSAGLTTMAVGMGVAAVATGYLTKAMAALGAASYAVPIVGVVSAVVGLGTAIWSLCDSAETAEDRLGDLTAQSDSLQDTMKSSKEAMKSSELEIEANAETASVFAARLAELEQQTSMTDAEMNEYRLTVETINGLIPDLNLKLDEQTGLLEGGAAALDQQITGWKELAIAQAMQEMYTEQLKATAKATAELNLNEAKLGITKTQLTSKIQERDRILNESAQAWTDYYAASNDYRAYRGLDASAVIDEAAAAAEIQGLQKRAKSLDGTYDTLCGDIETLQENEAYLTESIDENKRVIEENSAEVKAAEQAMRTYTESVNSGGEANTTYAEKCREIMAAADQLKAAYQEQYQAAYESISGQIGLFDSIATVAESNSARTSKSLLDSLNSEIAYMDEYQANMKAAAENGVSQVILDQLRDGSAESARILAGLAKAGEEEVSAINEAFSQVQDGKAQFADTMAEYASAVANEKDNMVDIFAEAGLDMSEAITAELLAGLPTYYNAIEKYADIGLPNNLHSVLENGYAFGTNSAASGIHLVGEKGPELILFRGGERVLDAEETRSAISAMVPATTGMDIIGAGAPAIAGPYNAQLRVQIAVPIDIDGREVAKATAEYMGEEMSWT